ncbi:solute carrier family 45 member 3-like [Lytechinus pictus]|uniref:solute carrier family 45 member 3-like n=1 Tax=Lytechinus pictus TaxID=7653 RepID=UPI0030BA1616
MGSIVTDSTIFSYRYLAMVNMITLGTELCSSAAFSYLPPLLLEAGFSESGMSTVMAMGPFMALFLLPVMGTSSDRCRSRFGRRRPYIAFLSVGIILSLILLPNTKAITAYFTSYFPEKQFGLMLLAACVVLLDFCSQVCYTPIESLLSDPCKTETQRNRSFGIFSLMMSLGACLGYWVVSVDWKNTLLGYYFGGQERTLFNLLLILFTFSFLISTYFAYDPPLFDAVPKDIAEATTANARPTVNGNAALKTANGKAITTVPMPISATSQALPFRIASTISVKNVCSSLFSYIPRPKIDLSPIADTLEGIRTMPKAMKTLWLAHLTTSTAVMGFRLYFTDYMGESIFSGNPDALDGSPVKRAYEEGIRMGSFGLLLHSIISAVFSVAIGAVITTWGAVRTYIFGMVLFTLATFFMLFMDGIVFTLLLASLTGFANATITTVPYTLLTGYHQKKELYYQDSDDADAHGKGADLALLDSAYILSEVISSFAFGVIVEITKTTGAYIACSFACGLASCFLVLRIK